MTGIRRWRRQQPRWKEDGSLIFIDFHAVTSRLRLLGRERPGSYTVGPLSPNQDCSKMKVHASLSRNVSSPELLIEYHTLRHWSATRVRTDNLLRNAPKFFLGQLIW